MKNIFQTKVKIKNTKINASIGLLSLLLVFGLVAFLARLNVPRVQADQGSSTTAPETSITFFPASTAVTSGSTFTLEADIEPIGTDGSYNEVQTLQTFVNYDPTIFSLSQSDITPNTSTFSDTLGVGVTNADGVAWLIQGIGGDHSAVTTDMPFATFTFHAISGTTGGGSNITFDTGNDKTVVLVNGSQDNALAGVAGTVVTVTGGTGPGTYTVTPSISVGGTYGTVTPDTPQTIDSGSQVQFTLNPDDGYFGNVVEDGCSGNFSDNVYTATITNDCSVSFGFYANDAGGPYNDAGGPYTVTPSVTVGGTHGTVTPDTTLSVYDGSNIYFVLNPDAGYYGSVVDDGCSGNFSDNVYTAAITNDCSVSFGFYANSPTTYTVTPSAGSGGIISPSEPQYIDYESTTQFTLTPNQGYHISSVSGTCGGSLSGGTGPVYTTNAVTTDCSVVANFATNPTLTINITGHGLVSTPGTFGEASCQSSDESGTTCTYDVYPPQEEVLLVAQNTYDPFSSWSGACTGSSADCDVTMNGNETVSATFTSGGSSPTTYTVHPTAGSHGTISPNTDQTIDAGSATQFTITPDSNYTASVASGGSNCGGSLVGTTYTTDVITGACNVAASFIYSGTGGGGGPYTVTPSCGSHGSCDPDTGQTIDAGSQAQFTLTPDSGYTPSAGGTCGGSLVGDVYTTDPVSGDCTVDFTFSNGSSNHSSSKDQGDKPAYISPVDIPALVHKHHGSKVWWNAWAKKKINYYTYLIGGFLGKTDATHPYFNIPSWLPKGSYHLRIRAYDKSKKTNYRQKTITVIVQ